MSLLTLVNAVQSEIGLPVSTSVVGNNDTQVVTLLALAQREGKDLAARATWQVLTKEFTHTTLATESQGAITSVFGTDFLYVVNQTMWDRSQNRPIVGSLTPHVWQMLKSNNITGPFSQFRIRQNTLYFIPVPSAGHTVAGEYYSKNWCQSSGLVGQNAWAADTDTGLLSEDLMQMGLHWRFLRSKGLEYAEQFADYERQVNDALGRDGGKMWLNMGGSNWRQNGPYVSEGSWNI